MTKIIVGLTILVSLVVMVLVSDLGKVAIPASPRQASENIPALSVFATNLEVPWAIAFLPNGEMLATERPGRVLLIDKSGKTKALANINVHAVSESGLHGVAIDPNFEENNYIYLYYTYSDEGNNTLNRVVRYKFENEKLSEEKIIVDRIPGAPNHDGGRIKFGPDGLLYITTGDAQKPSRAQDRNSLAGKILRSTRDGEPAPGNPFGTLIYSYGHRNPQGITWDERGQLWETEHGQSAHDEINKIEKGRNYGWPEIQGDETRDGMEISIVHSGTDTWAPAGATFYKGSIFFAGLRGSALYEYRINEQKLVEHLKNKVGRIREVVLGPDGLLYIATSNRDGRGKPSGADDKILIVKLPTL